MTENRDPRHASTPIRMSRTTRCPKSSWDWRWGSWSGRSPTFSGRNPTAPRRLGDQRVPAALAGPAAGTQTIAGWRRHFRQRCQACHQADGQGLPGVFPPLAGSAWVLAPPGPIAQILLHGVTGPMEVLGDDLQRRDAGFRHAILRCRDRRGRYVRAHAMGQQRREIDADRGRPGAKASAGRVPNPGRAGRNSKAFFDGGRRPPPASAK